MSVTQGRRAVLNDGYRFKNRKIIFLCKLVDGLCSFLPKRKGILPEHVGSVLVIKPDHLGDMLTLTSVLPLLRGRYRDARIDVLCHESSLPILENNPHVDRCIPFVHFLYNRGKIGWFVKFRRFIRDIFSLIRRLRQDRYDLCLNFRDSGGDMILVARLGGCRFIAGHATGGFGPLLDKSVPWLAGRHEVEHYLEVLRPLGIEAPLEGLRYELFPDEKDREQVDFLVRQYSLNKFIVIHPGTGDRKKLVDPRKWGEILEGTDADTLVVFTGTRDEQDLYEAVAGQVQRQLLNLMGLLTISQLYLLYCKAERIYTIDSLSAHLAAMTGVRTTVFWSSFVDADQWRPLGSNVELIAR